MGDKTKADTADQTFSASDVAAAKEDGIKQGAEQATSRIKAILTCDEAKGREEQAQTIALSEEFASLSADAAKALLATSPTEEQQSKVQTIEERAEGMDEMGTSTPQENATKSPLTDLAKNMNKDVA